MSEKTVWLAQKQVKDKKILTFNKNIKEQGTAIYCSLHTVAIGSQMSVTYLLVYWQTFKKGL